MNEKTRQIRDDTIREMFKDGTHTISELAELFGMSFQNCWQIVKTKKAKKKKKPKRKLIPDRTLSGRDYKRELIRQYFNYTCQKCGKVWKEGERRFDVHHFNCGSQKARKYDTGPIQKVIKSVSLFCHKCHLNLPEHRKKMSEKSKNNWAKRQGWRDKIL